MSSGRARAYSVGLAASGGRRRILAHTVKRLRVAVMPAGMLMVAGRINARSCTAGSGLRKSRPGENVMSTGMGDRLVRVAWMVFIPSPMKRMSSMSSPRSLTAGPKEVWRTFAGAVSSFSTSRFSIRSPLLTFSRSAVIAATGTGTSIMASRCARDAAGKSAAERQIIPAARGRAALRKRCMGYPPLSQTPASLTNELDRPICNKCFIQRRHVEVKRGQSARTVTGRLAAAA